MKAIITVSANASQNEQTCIGPNELTRQLVSRPCIDRLIGYMLGGGNALTVGVGIVIEVIRKNNSDYDPDVGAEAPAVPSSRDPIYLGTLLRIFAENVPRFMTLIMHGPARKDTIESTFGERIEPLGFDRFKTCELMAELLHCSNMGLLNEPGSEDLIAARDAERLRLRAEGRLPPARPDDEGPSSAAADDLTMRMRHSSPGPDTTNGDGARRLEVMNVSDDDGFEEVTHAADMADEDAPEDITSHEFVRAEDEIPHALPASSSFLDRDEDDFVDEPLSSPRLRVRDDLPELEPQDQQPPFEDADLIVAPLSPSKNKAVAADEGEAAAAETKEDAEVATPTDKIDEMNLDDDNDNESDDDDDDDGSDKPEVVDAAEGTPGKMDVGEESEDAETPIIFTPTASSIPDAEKPSPETTDAQPTAEEPSGLPAVGSLSPHAEDTPAPLFSGRPSKTNAARRDDEAPTAGRDDENLPSEPAAAVPERPTTATATATTATATSAATAEAGEASSTVVAAPGDDTQATIDEGQLAPVVGDYLKMQFVEHRVVPTILSFFFAYPWNNFLHNVVYDIVQQVFNGPMDRGYNPTLAVSLFEAADVTSQIIAGQLASEASQARTRTRMGYMGHLTLIAEEVVKFTERHPPELLSEAVLEKVMVQDWINYVEGALAETRERDNAILGGVRPEVALSNRAAAAAGGSGLSGVGLSGLGSALGLGQGLSALAEAGLNGGLDVGEGEGGSSGGVGGAGNGIGPFAISAGTMMSGFGSSSDEDDDGSGEDNDEDVANEVSCPLPTCSLSLSPVLALDPAPAIGSLRAPAGSRAASHPPRFILGEFYDSSSSSSRLGPSGPGRLPELEFDDGYEEDDHEEDDQDEDEDDDMWYEDYNGVYEASRRLHGWSMNTPSWLAANQRRSRVDGGHVTDLEIPWRGIARPSSAPEGNLGQAGSAQVQCY